jgi:hypothetical protein
MIGYWPGSAVHQRATLENPRFEDFEYGSFDDGSDLDILSWMGNGMIEAQVHKTSTTGYLDTVDIPPVPRSHMLPPTPPTPPEDGQDKVPIRIMEPVAVVENDI